MYCKSCILLKQTRYFLVMAIVVLIMAINAPWVSAEEKPDQIKERFK